MTAPAIAATATVRDRWGPRSPWVLPEDGIIDHIAVELAATGARRVALTPGERLAVAARVIAAGGTPHTIARRLGCNSRAAHALAAAARAQRLGLDDIPPGEWACQRCGAAHFGAEPEDGLCGDCRTAGGGR
jgi:hypothetical protein